ncbi:hypothetical protein J2Z37_004917, partial [Ammoniphilus resinae]|nr:hypothetical protein [Ammoniphilus resinae]
MACLFVRLAAHYTYRVQVPCAPTAGSASRQTVRHR